MIVLSIVFHEPFSSYNRMIWGDASNPVYELSAACPIHHYRPRKCTTAKQSYAPAGIRTRAMSLEGSGPTTSPPARSSLRSSRPEARDSFGITHHRRSLRGSQPLPACSLPARTSPRSSRPEARDSFGITHHRRPFRSHRGSQPLRACSPGRNIHRPPKGSFRSRKGGPTTA